MPVFSHKIHSNTYRIALMICAFALPISVFLISLSQVLLLTNWLFEEPLKERWNKFKSCKPLWFISLFYLIHLLGLIPTVDFAFAWHDLHIKLPFLILPLIVGTSGPIPYNWLKRILYSFISGVFISSLYSTWKIYTLSGDIMSKMPEISPFIWHIRLALMAVFATLVLPWLYINEKVLYLRILFSFLFAWFIFFLFVFQSLTGLYILGFLILIFSIYGIYKLKSLLLRWFILLAGITIILVLSSAILHYYTKNFSPLPININLLEKYTLNGNPYFHNPKHTNIENGNYVDLYICSAELEKEWTKRSKIGIDSTNNNHTVRNTLIRYLTSKGLNKDSIGIAQLSEDDISNIENGIANEIFTRKAGFTSRIYRSMWELYHYSKGANPSGYSVALRIEYLKTAYEIIKQNFWFGTGTGDVLLEFQNQYKSDKSLLSLRWRLRAHNQFLTFLLTFGIFGFLAICMSLFIPPFLTKKYKNYLFGIFFIIIVLSMLTDDTLETHAAISFFALFYSVFLFNDSSLTYTSEEKNPG